MVSGGNVAAGRGVAPGQVYIAESNLPWSAPESRDLGWRGLMHDQIHAASLGDMEPRLPDMLNDHGRS